MINIQQLYTQQLNLLFFYQQNSIGMKSSQGPTKQVKKLSTIHVRTPILKTIAENYVVYSKCWDLPI